MKICLINPPLISKKFNGYEWSKNSFTIQHLGLGYIAGMLEANGYLVDIIECPGKDIDVNELLEILNSEDYDVIGITTYFYNFINVLRITNKLRMKNSKSFIFLGGYLPTLCHEVVLKKAKGIDCCVMGEGEFTCLELVGNLDKGLDWKDTLGITYKENDNIVQTPMRPQIHDLDNLPFPKRVIINQRFIPLATSRGCYGKCNFCGVREFYEVCNIKKMRFRSPENVIEEIEILVKKYNPGMFLFSDETFFCGSLARREWLHQFYTLLKNKNLNIKFQALGRANDIISNREMIEKLVSVGLDNLFIGAESFVQRQLDFYEKKTTVKKNVDAIEIAIASKVKLSLGLMLLDPFTTIDELLQNINLILDTGCYKYVDENQELLSIDGPVIAIPGTKLYSYLEDRGLLADNEFRYEFQDSDVSIYYKIINIWREFVQPISEKFYYIKIAEVYQKEVFYSELKELKAEIVRLDINFLKMLCVEIKDKSMTIQDCTSLLEEWKCRIQTIYADYLHLIEELCMEIGLSRIE
ncbi:MAG: hypothetical protein RHS_1244 [Robinsoniella sp. RHS]|uniref:B12-binding domain-containing radical SAM protein n=1 Tax=Robinsoniella sp. RHS TaxID=1504536 RepID=UPI00064AD4EC|nr:MAG: hypothetical protein RHS_1244 [Robinsoniella sp. RHS]